MKFAIGMKDLRAINYSAFLFKCLNKRFHATYHFTHLLKGSLCEQVTFDPGQGLVWIVVRLLYQAELLSL